MSTTISPLRRITVTLALTGAAAFGAVAVAPSAFADDSMAPAITVPAPVVPDPAVVAPPVVPDPAVVAPPVVPDPAVVAPPVVAPPAVVTPPVVPPPAVVLDKNGKPVKAPKTCSDKDLADSAKKVADATKKAAPLLAMATSSHKAADLVRAQEVKLTVKQVVAAEALANGLDMVGDKFAAQAQASIDKAAVLDCFIVAAGGRF